MDRRNERRDFLRHGFSGAVLTATVAAPHARPALSQEQATRLATQQADRHAVLELLAKRQSSRSFGPQPLPDQVLANLLWAAAGVNRPESGRRTAPTANNRQEVDVYVATARGLYLYEPKSHSLQPVLAKDVRELTGRQSFVREAAVNLVFVADYARSSAVSEEDKLMYAAAATGCMSQNVYLYCASEGLATVVRAAIDRPALAEALKLRHTQKITLAQSVGYPGK